MDHTFPVNSIAAAPSVNEEEAATLAPCSGTEIDFSCTEDTELETASALSVTEDEAEKRKSKLDYVEKYQLHEPLHPNLTISKLSVLLMILHLAVRHCNTQSFIEDHIKFINTIFGDSVLNFSYFLFKKLFEPSCKLSKHYFCPNFQVVVASLDNFDDSQKYTNCPKRGQEVNVHSVDSGNYFVTLSVREQIQELLKKPGIKLIPTRARTSDFIADIYDGELYTKLSQNGLPLSNENSLTVTFNTDGVAVHKSTKNSLWPIWLYVNEICPTQRFKTENLILAGVWFGRSSPNMSMYLKPFLNELLELSAKGVELVKPGGDSVTCPVFAIACSVDSVAKPKLMCMKQFNAFSGCQYCTHPNDTSIGDDRLHRYYDTSSSYTERTEEEVFCDMPTADQLQREGKLKSDSVNGFVGISVLTMFSKLLRQFPCSTFHIVWSVAIDYMHCLLEGVSKDLLNLFESLLSEHNIVKLDERIKGITPPQGMTRRPRSFKERQHWKAKEYRAFILYYALPCLEDLLPLRYYANLKLFVQASHILLSDKITNVALSEARLALQNFTVTFQKLYGLKNVTYNLHLCTHLVKVVSFLGPLFCYSNFVFESGNGYLIRLIRGTRSIVNEISTKYRTIQSASKYFFAYDISPKAEKFCSDLVSFKYNQRHEECDGVYLTGSSSVVRVSEEEEGIMLRENGIFVFENNSVTCYNRVIRDGINFASTCYAKVTVFDDSCVKLKDGSYATVDKIVRSSSLLCVTKPIRIVQDATIIPQILKCAHNMYDKEKIVSFSTIERKCILIKFEHKAFICHIPNFYERD